MGDGSSGSNPLSALSGLSSGFSNLFSGAGGANAAVTGDPSGMSGYDTAGLFGSLPDQAFNEDTASIQATQAITPPAQAQANAATGQDPSAGIGGTQTGAQTASTGPGGQNQNQPSQEQQDQEQRNKAIDDLKRILRQRQKQQQEPPQWNPRYASAAAISPQAAIDAGLSAPNISPDAAVRAGLLDPSMIDPATGQIRRGYRPDRNPYPEGESSDPEYGPGYDPRQVPTVTRQPGVPAAPAGAPASDEPAPGAEGRHITVRPQAPLPPRTVPGTPGAPPGTPDTPLRIPGLPGLGPILRGIGLGAAEGPLIGIGAVPLSATPAETGEFTPAEPNFVRPDAPVGTHGLPAPADPPAAPDAPLPPPRPKDQPKPAAKPRTAQPHPHAPQRVWVPPTPGHYIPTPGNARGTPTWVPGTPGHYVEGHRSSPAAVSPAGGVHNRDGYARFSEARAEAPAASPEVMAYNQDARIMPTILRDIAGLGIMPRTLSALAGDHRQLPPNTPSSAYGKGGTRPYDENWGGAAYVAKGDEVQRGRQYMGYLTGKGLTRQGAAALLGNAHQESNLSATLAPGGDGGTAAGMFQWRGPRLAAFRRWLQANGHSETDPHAHLDFALYEMQTNPAYRASWEALHNPNLSPAQIADIIANNYEGSKRGPTQRMNNRIGFANSMLQGGGTGTTVPMPIQASGGDAQG